MGLQASASIDYITPLNNSIGLEDSLKMDWEDVAEVTGYELQYSTDSTYYTSSYTIQTVSSDAIIENLTPNTKYYWRVRTSGGEYKSIFNTSWNFTVQDTLPNSISSPLINDYMIFPNPATRNVYIKQLDQTVELITYKLIDLNGRSIKHGALDANSIDVSGIEKGMYIIKLASNTNIVISKTIIIE